MIAGKIEDRDVMCGDELSPNNLGARVTVSQWRNRRITFDWFALLRAGGEAVGPPEEGFFE